jgi:hypothetical protein
MVRVACLAVLVSLVVSCVESHSCTEIGCADQASITLRTQSGAWEAGEYALRIAFDGGEHACSFTIPDALPSGGNVGEIDCTPGANVYFYQETTCTEHSDGYSSSQSCTPVPDQYYLQASIYGTPATVQVVLSREGATLVDTENDLAYSESRPNGPDCEPLCRQATLELIVP